jgi:succinate dehydrogenase/fumarate reductase flavoprotein subunit
MNFVALALAYQPVISRTVIIIYISVVVTIIVRRDTRMKKRLEDLADMVIDTDFLIIGGGLVGSMAALRAKKRNKELDVTIIDKAKMEYSGDGVGLDNFSHFPLKLDGMQQDFTEADATSATFGAKRMQGFKSSRLDAIRMKHAYNFLPLLEEIGVKIGEDDGTFKVIQGYRKGTVWGRLERDEQGKPTEPFFGTLSRAADLKLRLGTAVRKMGTRVLDRTMLTSIITRDGVAMGATAINTRTGKFLVIRAKTVLLATGMAARLYPYPWAPFPNNLFYLRSSPVNHGGGLVAALNAGAKLYCMEMCTVYNVSKGINMSSAGGACNWYFPMYNSKGEVLEEKYQDRVVTKAGGMIPGVNFLFAPDMFNAEVEKDVIMSAKDQATRDELVHMYLTAATEPPKGLKFHMLAGGLLNESPAECVPVFVGIGMATGGVLRENEYSETGVKNLFASGYVCGSGGSGGLTWGCLIADHVLDRVQSLDLPAIDVGELEQIEQTRTRVFAPLGRKVEYPINTLELEHYVRWVNHYYVGYHKIKARLERAVELIRFAREQATPLLSADNPHELMRAG